MTDAHADGSAASSGFLAQVASLLGRLADEQKDPLAAAAQAVSRTLINDGLVHVFGSGHSHMVALEGFYRAGGLAAVDPVLVESLMLHGNAVLSTAVERTAGIGRAVFTDLAPGGDDTFILVSNSGRNQVAVELALAARAQGLTVIAIVSRAHAASTAHLHLNDAGLVELADIVIDNLGAAGDAATAVPGVAAPMGPTSTATGAAIIHAIAMDAAAIAAAAGQTPAVFTSSNVPGGDELNVAAIARYRGRVRSL